MKSIIQNDHNCWLCQRIGLSTPGTDLHHMLHGTFRRKLADEDGLTVYLCKSHHVLLHDKGFHDLQLQQEAQQAWMYHYNKSVEDFIKRYGKSYL